jgi:hypothetical protein
MKSVTHLLDEYRGFRGGCLRGYNALAPLLMLHTDAWD